MTRPSFTTYSYNMERGEWPQLNCLRVEVKLEEKDNIFNSSETGSELPSILKYNSVANK